MPRRIKRHIPKVRSTNRAEDRLYEIHITPNATVYNAIYDCRGHEEEVFVAKTEDEAIKHFLAVSDGDIPPAMTVGEWDKMHEVEQDDKFTIDLFQETGELTG